MYRYCGNVKLTLDLSRYMMIFLFPVIFLIWKLIKKTKMHSPEQVNLTLNMSDIEEYEKAYVQEPPKTVVHKYMTKIFE